MDAILFLSHLSRNLACWEETIYGVTKEPQRDLRIFKFLFVVVVEIAFVGDLVWGSRWGSFVTPTYGQNNEHERATVREPESIRHLVP